MVKAIAMLLSALIYRARGIVGIWIMLLGLRIMPEGYRTTLREMISTAAKL